MLFTKQNFFLSNAIRDLSRDKLFLVGLLIKIFLIASISPSLTTNLFLPFLKNSIENFSLNPWDNFLLTNNEINSFPYGLIMVIAYFPISFFGNLIDKFIYDFNFIELGFKLTSLLFDYFLLIFLSLITSNKSKKLLIFCFWLSPIAIYTNYIHGQLDIVPIALLICSVFFIKNNNYSLSGLILSLSISSKFSMLIALPFFIIYIYKRRGIQQEFFKFVVSLTILNLLTFIPYLSSNSFWEMVLKTKELDRIYTIFISYGSDLRLYVLPVVYIFSLYLFWRLQRITLDLFLISVGIGFLSILVFLPPAPGWSLWIVPFFAYYQIVSKKDIILICFFYNFIYLVNTIFSLDILNQEFLFLEEIINNFNLTNFMFTLQQCFGLLLALRMYFYGLKRNEFYSTSNKSLRFEINGNNKDSIFKLIDSLKNLIYQKDLYINSTNSIIQQKSFKVIDNLKFENKTKIDYFTGSVKEIYYANYMSDVIYKIEKELFENKKPYQLIYNDSNIDLELLTSSNSIRLEINYLNSFNLKEISFQQIKNNSIFIYYRLLSKRKINKAKRYSIITYFPLGFLHNKLFNLFIAISSLNVDIELIKNQRVVKMEIEGFPSNEDIKEIALNLIPELDDLSLNEYGWEGGYIGIIQIIIIANLSNILKNKKF